MGLLQLMRSTLEKRQLASPRQIAVTKHWELLAGRDPDELLRLVNPESGAWPVRELATHVGGVALSVVAWRSHDPSDDTVLFRVDHKGRLGKRFVDGFAVSKGLTRPLTGDEWGLIDLKRPGNDGGSNL